jgi:ribosomal protein L34
MAERGRSVLKRRRTWLIGLLAVVVAGAVWLVAVRPGAISPAGGGGECGSGAAVTVAAGRLYGRPWSVTATRGAGNRPCFQMRMSDRNGRSVALSNALLSVPAKPGEWNTSGLDGSRIIFSFGTAAPDVVRYELRLAGATRVRITPVAYSGVRYFGFAYSTDRLANYVETVAGYDSKDRRVVAMEPWDEGRPRSRPKVSALRAPAVTIGSGVVDGVYWRVQELPVKSEDTYAKAGFELARRAFGRPSNCVWLTVGGISEAPNCDSWPPSVFVQPNMPMNGTCSDSGVPTICTGVLDSQVDHLVLTLGKGRRQTLRPVMFHGYRFTAFAYSDDHPARSLTALNRDGVAIATTDFTTEPLCAVHPPCQP